MQSKTSKDILTVGQLNKRIRSLLEKEFLKIHVEGEVSNFVQATSGHWYFTLKDISAQIRCVMFKGFNQRVSTKPVDGQKVVVTGKVSLYENRGDYQILADHIEEAGKGDLQKAFEQLKIKLESEGLFDSMFKQPLPFFPSSLAVITSGKGAAIHDILNVLRKRYPAMSVTVLPVAVQGKKAATEISYAIKQANKYDFDIIILARGGGSIEDLWPFNEEAVARAIFSSEIPIVTGIGHETDFSISDFVSDHRAPTPSAAAEQVSPDQQELLIRVKQFDKKLKRNISTLFRHKRQVLQIQRTSLIHPGHKIREQAQTLDHMVFSLRKTIEKSLFYRLQNSHILQKNLLNNSPSNTINQYKQMLQKEGESLNIAIENFLIDKNTALGNAVSVLNAISPLNTLQRGYSVLKNEKGEIIQSVDQVQIGENITARMANGSLNCTVKKTIMNE